MLNINHTVKFMIMAAIAISPSNATKAHTKTQTSYKGHYHEYFNAISAKESSHRYHIENKHGYLGKYQLGEMALTQAGFYQTSYHYYNNWKGTWSHNINSKNDFLKNPKLQERAMRLYTSENWRLIKFYRLDEHINSTHNNIEITASGLLAGAHLVGIGGLRTYLDNGEEVTDGNNVPISTYIAEMAGYKTPFH